MIRSANALPLMLGCAFGGLNYTALRKARMKAKLRNKLRIVFSTKLRSNFATVLTLASNSAV